MKREIWEARAALIRSHADEGMTVKQISNATGFTAATIRKYAKSFIIGFDPKHAKEIRELADQGLCQKEIAQRIGVAASTVSNVAATINLKIRHGGSNPPKSVAKATAMAAMYQSGKTLQEIGEAYGVTRERVRQLIAKYTEVRAANGGKSVVARRGKQAAAVRREAKCFAKHGCTIDQLESVRAIAKTMMESGLSWYRTPLGAFNAQRTSARARSIEWSMTFWDWWTVWQESGKWGERGLGRDRYMMCRFADAGGYAVGNVYIATHQHNSAHQVRNPCRKGHPDHEKWRARSAPRLRNRTEPSHGLPRGVTRTKGRFMAQISVSGRNRYLGCFGTAEEASQAYESARSNADGFCEAAE